jgi:hypothetical protein
LLKNPTQCFDGLQHEPHAEAVPYTPRVAADAADLGYSAERLRRKDNCFFTDWAVPSFVTMNAKGKWT